ncbi:UbiA family prenyltransferase [Gammaproteobacteria bacterium]|nr:UbiA family prenyltransferase [Gammaproteobacteria bacterium]
MNNITIWIKQLRIHHWLKNIIIFVPAFIVASSDYLSLAIIYKLIVAFFTFSIVASFVYILNDLIDIKSDISHPTKSKRPLAAGSISVSSAYKALFVFGVVILIILIFLNFRSSLLILTYLMLNILYSKYLKKVLLLDCFVLSSFYTLRIIYGAVVINIPLSFWLIAFSTFFFLSLAFAKRYSELLLSQELVLEDSFGRSYKSVDMPFLSIFGISSGVISVLILALYINSPTIYSNFNYPYFIWTVVYSILFWIGWVWLNVMRGNINIDPILFAVNDRLSSLIAILIFIMFVLSKSGNYYSFI